MRALIVEVGDGGVGDGSTGFIRMRFQISGTQVKLDSVVQAHTPKVTWWQGQKNPWWTVKTGTQGFLLPSKHRDRDVPELIHMYTQVYRYTHTYTHIYR